MPIIKKAQVSYFIFIVGIIVLSYLLLTYSKGSTYQDTALIKTPIKEIRNYAEGCLKGAAADSLFYTALQGGIYNDTNNTISYPFFIIPVYSQRDTKLVPPLSRIEQQLSFSMEDNVLRCVDNFTAFKSKGIELYFEKPITETRLLDNQAFFEVNFPIRIIEENEIFTVPSIYTIPVTTSYKKLYEFASDIAVINSQDPKVLCISCLVSLSEKNNINTLVTNFDTETIVFTVSENKLEDANNKNLIFRFAHRKNDAEI